MTFTTELKWRGLIDNCTDLEAADKLKDCSFYCGFDPTAPSLQIGNLTPFMAMAHISKTGLQPIVLLGGATGAIGDPSGKSAERVLLESKVVEENVELQKKQFLDLFKKVGAKPTIVNNADWFGKINFIEFLRDVGKHFSVGYMLQKESVKTRVNGDGMSYTEFSYMLLQAYDFYHLFKTQNCRLHVGGSDQWGNITAGLELIRRKNLDGAVAMTFPLITNSQGKKFGKSESGTLWIDPLRTSPFRMHQYLLNVEDSEVIKLLKLLTFNDSKEIARLEDSLKTAPEKREAQKALADSICTFVHDKTATDLAIKSAAVLFGGSLDGLTFEQLKDIFADVPSTELSNDKLTSLTYGDLLIEAQLVKSKGEAKRLVQNGGAYLNNQRVSEVDQKISDQHLIGGKILVLRSGKKNYHLVQALKS